MEPGDARSLTRYAGYGSVDRSRMLLRCRIGSMAPCIVSSDRGSITAPYWISLASGVSQVSIAMTNLCEISYTRLHFELRWLISHNREKEGLEILQRLHVRPGDTSDIAAKEEYYQIRKQIE
jgi:hypothetical protein